MNKNRLRIRLLAVGLGVSLHAPVGAQSLHEAVEQAVRTNPEVLASADRRLATDEQLKQAQAGYFPRVDLNTGYGRERLDSLDTRLLGLSDTAFTRREAGLTLSQMLFDGFGVKNDVARQEARVGSSAHQVNANAEDIALRAVGAYLEVLRRQDTVAFAKENLASHLRIHDMIEQRTEGGYGRRSDFDQSKSRLALAKANLRQEWGSLKDAEATFLRLVGAQPAALTKPVVPARTIPASEQAALDAALTNHPVIRSASLDLEAARAQHEVAKAALYPRFDFEVSGSHGRDDVRGRSDDYSAMLRRRYNLFRGGADKAKVSETRFQIDEASESLNRVRRQVAENLSLSFSALHTARDRVDTLRQYVESSDATREGYAKQFSIGQRTLLDLLNAENEYFSARSAFVTAEYTELLAVYRVFAGMGQLLDALDIPRPTEALPQMAGR